MHIAPSPVRNVRGEAEEAFIAMLAELSSVDAVRPLLYAKDLGADVVVHLLNGATVAFEVKAMAHPSPHDVEALIRRSLARPGETVPVLVADAIPEAARRKLAEAGWSYYDRQGTFFLQTGDTLIERSVRPSPPRAGSRPAGIRGASGLAVAFAHLLEPRREPGIGVRELSRAAGVNGTAVSHARRALVEANLLHESGEPVIPDLFWALAAQWSTPLVGLAEAPTPETVAELGHNVDGPYAAVLAPLSSTELEAEGGSGGLGAAAYEGAALGGTAAAAVFGAPVVRGADAPFDLYLPGEVVLSRLRRRHGETGVVDRAAGVRAFPVKLAARVRLEARNGSLGFPVVHPLVAALDLAQDEARGHEILDDFTPPSPFERVW